MSHETAQPQFFETIFYYVVNYQIVIYWKENFVFQTNIFRNSFWKTGAGRKERMTQGQHVPLIPWATHIIQWPLQRVATRRLWANRQKRPQFGLKSATRLHEAGIASNHRSAKLWWIRSQVLYSPPVNSREPGVPEAPASVFWDNMSLIVILLLSGCYKENFVFQTNIFCKSFWKTEAGSKVSSVTGNKS